MPKYINADALTKRIDEELCKPCRDEKQDYKGVRCRACWVDDMLIWIDSEPEVTADVREVVHGQWQQEDIVYGMDIEAWQSAKCSVCGRFHTTPFLYYFNGYNYCPHCGAKMDG